MTALLHSVRTWAEMVKLSHSVFALPLALIATILAGRQLEGRHVPHAGQLALIVVCMVAARSVAMTFNRIVDAAIDARNLRTAMRPLPAGQITFLAAYAMLILSIITFGAGCLGFAMFYGNYWPILLAGPVLIYLAGYSFTKRFTKWSHLYLGSAIALAPGAAWLAIHPASFGTQALLLMLIVTCWIGGFDIIYACQDIEVDRREGLHSIPAWLGIAAALWLGRMCHLLTVALLIAVGALSGLGWPYWVGVAAVAGLLLYEHTLVSPADLSKLNLAFFNVNGYISVTIFAATLTALLVA